MSVARRKGIFGTGSSLSSRLFAGGRQNVAAEVKKQSGINGLLPALGAGPFHLFRLHLDLRCDVLKKVTVTFPSEKVFSKRRPFGSQTLVVAQCRGGNLPNRRQARQNKKRRPIPRVIGSVHCIPTGSIFVSVVAPGPRSAPSASHGRRRGRYCRSSRRSTTFPKARAH